MGHVRFFFLLLHTSEATLSDYCPQHGVRKVTQRCSTQLTGPLQAELN